MKKKAKASVIVLLVIRIILWTTALVSTVYWIYYSFDLYNQGYIIPEEYSPRLRPVLYTCVLIAVAAIAISFLLHAISKKIKDKAEKESRAELNEGQ